MKKDLGDKVANFIGYTSCIIALLCFFALTYLGLFANFAVKIEDIFICLVSAIIFFISAKIKRKQDS